MTAVLFALLTAICAVFVHGATPLVDQNPNCLRMASGGGCAQADVLKYCPKSCKQALEKEKLLETLKQTVEGLVKNLNSLQVQHSDLQNKHTTTVQTLKLLEGKVSKVETENKALKAEVQGINTSNAQNAATVSGLKTENQALRAQVQALKKSVANNTAEASAMKAENQALRVGVQAVKTSSATNAAQVSALKAEVVSMKTCCADTNKRVQGIERQLQNNWSMTKKVEKRVKNVEINIKTVTTKIVNVENNASLDKLKQFVRRMNSGIVKEATLCDRLKKCSSRGLKVTSSEKIGGLIPR